MIERLQSLVSEGLTLREIDTQMGWRKGTATQELKRLGIERPKLNPGRKALDLAGQTFGFLTAVERIKEPGVAGFSWRCDCKCGNEVVMQAGKLTRNDRQVPRSCGCYWRERLVGTRYGKLVVVKAADVKGDTWELRCDCGNNCVLSTSTLHNGRTTCGECTSYTQLALGLTEEEWRTHVRLVNMYGITLAEYNQMVEDQKSECLICHKKFEKLVVDHDHSTGKVRGLLCLRCNLALGQFSDDVSLLRGAIEYLNR